MNLPFYEFQFVPETLYTPECVRCLVWDNYNHPTQLLGVKESIYISDLYDWQRKNHPYAKSIQRIQMEA